MTRPFDLVRRLRAGVASVLLLSATGSYALNTATIVGSVASPDCLEYRVVGICYWLYCTWTGCAVRTSIKVRHYIPDAVVSSYRSEEHTSELQSLMRISYAVFCLKKKKKQKNKPTTE